MMRNHEPVVMLDYIRYYGEDAISGLHFVGGVSKLGSDEALAVLAPEFLSLAPGFFSTDVEQSVRSMTALLRMCCAQEPSAEELYLMLGYNLSVPPYVRQAMFARTLDNDDLLPKIRKPVLITHGTGDAVVKPVVVEQHVAHLAHAQVDMMANAGHIPFWDDTPAFNLRLRAFAESL
jgi:pimeloyl-ACP methyl ester carboxylesterase